MKVEARHDEIFDGEFFYIDHDYDLITAISVALIDVGEEWLDENYLDFTFRFDFDSTQSGEVDYHDTEMFLLEGNEEKLEAYFVLCDNNTYFPNDWHSLSSIESYEDYGRDYINDVIGQSVDVIDSFIDYEGFGEFLLTDANTCEVNGTIYIK